MQINFFLLVFSLWLFSAPAAMAQSLQGVFMVVKGDIKVVSPDGKSDAAKVGKKVSSGDSIVAGADARAKIVMADKNVINISPDSKITIEKYENDGKDKKNVELKVEYGKIRASVEEKYDGEKSKFNIKTPSAVAGVRGTDFLTGYQPSTRATSVVTFSGTVAVGKPGPGGSIQNPVFVRQGQMTNASGSGVEQPKAVPKEELNKMNSDTKADAPKNDGAKENQGGGEKKSDDKKEEDKKEEPKKDEAKSDEKKDEGKKDEAKKDEPKKDEAKKDDAKKDEPKKDEAKRDEPKKDEAKKDQVADKKPDQGGGEKRDNANSGDSANNRGPDGSGGDTAGGSNASNGPGSGPANGPNGAPAGGGTAPRAPASAMPGMGMINMNDLPTAPGGGAVPKMPVAGPAVPIMMPPNIAPTLPTYLPPPPVTGKVKVNIILNPQ